MRGLPATCLANPAAVDEGQKGRRQGAQAVEGVIDNGAGAVRMLSQICRRKN
jgi:hypothetical protein